MALLRASDESCDGEPGGLSDLLAAAEQCGIAPDAASDCIERGLADAAPLVALLQ